MSCKQKANLQRQQKILISTPICKIKILLQQHDKIIRVVEDHNSKQFCIYCIVTNFPSTKITPTTMPTPCRIFHSFNVTCRSSSTVICLIVQSAILSTYYYYILLFQNFNFSKCTMTKLHPKLYTINSYGLCDCTVSWFLCRRLNIPWPFRLFFKMTIFSILCNLFYLRSSVIF